MLTIALSTLRMRWVSFVGTFTALALGVGLIAAAGLVLAASVAAPARPPQRYMVGPAVVAPADTLSVSTRLSGLDSAQLADSPGLPADLVDDVAATGRVVPDRSFYAQVAGVFPDAGAIPNAAAWDAEAAAGGDPVGHGWSAAPPTGYALTAGSAPAHDDEVVVAGLARPGDRVRVRTVAGSRLYTVVGTVSARRSEAPVFFTDAEAARLSPQVDALIAYGPVHAVRAAVGDRARVLSGAGLAALDPDRTRDAAARNDTNALVGIVGGFAAFVAIFVVAATFGYSVVQRRREFALLRTTGATPRQIRRMLFGEVALVSTAASAIGCVLGPLAAPSMLDRLIALGMAPDWLPDSTSWVPLAVAFATGTGVGLSGVLVASWRAGRTRPVEALREAAVDTRALTWGRLLVGGVALCSALVMFTTTVLDPESATSDKTYMPMVMVLTVAVGLLSPLAVAPVTRAVTRLGRSTDGAIGMLVRENTLTSVRRTAATAAPVLVTVGLTALLGGAAGMIDHAENASTGRTVLADYVVRPIGAPGFDRALVARFGAVDGVDVAAPVPTTVYAVHAEAKLIGFPAQAVTPTTLALALDTPVLAGSMADVKDDSIAVPEHWARSVGDLVDVWLADGRPAKLRVAAVLAEGPLPYAYLTPGTAPVWLRCST
ncbi:ABC transporter permease [Micromonospora zhanjiangensis]